MWASSALNEYLDLPYLRQVCCVERTVTRKEVSRQETACAITSLSVAKASAQRLQQIWRGHWGIENRLHNLLDVTLKEDASQIRTGSASEVMAVLRNVVVGLLRWAWVANIAATLRHYRYKPKEALALLGLSYP